MKTALVWAGCLVGGFAFLFCVPRSAQAQPGGRAIRVIGDLPAVGPVPASDVKPAEKKEEPAVDVPRAPAVDLGPKHIRLHLLDGSVISGDLSVSEIEVETSFGKLVVPIDRIRSLKPGLDSYPKVLA